MRAASSQERDIGSLSPRSARASASVCQPAAGAAAWIQRQRGWRGWLVAALAGGVSILAMAPFFAWPLLFVTLPTLVWLIEAARRPASEAVSATLPATAARSDAVLPAARVDILRAAGIGWVFGFSFHVFGLYWLREAFLVTGGSLALLWPLGVLGVPAYLGLYHGAAAAIAASVPGSVVRRVLVFAVAFSALEWVRGWLFTGFPWNVLGTALTYPLALMQSVSVLGIYGLTLLAVPILALPWVLLASPAGTARIGRMTAAAMVGLLPVAMLAAFGAIRLSATPPPVVPGVKLRLVQPSIPQRAKWQSERQLEFFRRHLALSRLGPAAAPVEGVPVTYVRWQGSSGAAAAGRTGSATAAPSVAPHGQLSAVTLVLWPEAAMPFMPLRHPQVLAEIGGLLAPATHLLAGILRGQSDGAAGFRAFNSAAAFGPDGEPLAIYDKTHLVPFGEYLPFQEQLEAIGLQTLTRQRGGFATGRTPRPLMTVPGLPPLGVLICYEALFPAAVIAGPRRPGVLVNLTNDGWFGDSTGPRLHLHQTRLRTVEEGLPLLRIANNGISAIYDAYGRELARLGLDVPGVIDADLPGALSPPLYARAGDLVFMLLWSIAAATLAWHTARDRTA